MINALMETVHEEMVWAPEMGTYRNPHIHMSIYPDRQTIMSRPGVAGMWTLSSKTKQTSALRLAASRGHYGCVEELLFRGAEVDADPGGSAALHDACVGGHAVCVQLLLSHGANPELLSAEGNAPLHLCTSAQSFQ